MDLKIISLEEFCHFISCFDLQCVTFILMFKNVRFLFLLYMNLKYLAVKDQELA